MKPDSTVLRETRHLVIGLLIVSVITNFIFAGLGKWDYTVVTGALLGTLAATLNFFLLGLTVQQATEQTKNPKQYAHRTYAIRMLLMMGLLVCGILLPWFNAVATIVPVLMETPVILILKLVLGRKE